MEQNEECLDQIKNQEEAVVERFVDKWMEQNFAVMFEDVGHERSLILILSLTDTDILGQSKFYDHENDYKKFSFGETTSSTLFEGTRSHFFIRITIRIVFSF